MKRIKINHVEQGDILFTARPGKVSGAIRIATGGLVSHAMICVQHGSFIDSTSDGVQARNIQREVFEDDEEAFHFRLREPVASEVMARIVDYARSEIGTRYAIREALRSVAAIHRPKLKKQFCSRLVARAYREGGLELVRDSDYCSPEDLRRSPLLTELPVEFEAVSDEELIWMSGELDPIKATHQAYNAVLDAGRLIDPELENFDDLYDLLIKDAGADQVIAAALNSSGYLYLWKIEVERYPWRYFQGQIDELSLPSEDVREYCIETVKEAYSGGLRFAVNLLQLRMLQEQHPRKSFRLKISLYETLVRNDQSRREVAYEWLQMHYPDLLNQHMEEIEPHSPYWYSIIDRVEPKLAALSRAAVASIGCTNVCSSCGDQPSSPFRLVNGAETMPGVPSLRLCDECTSIRRGMGNILVPFLSSFSE